MWKHFKVDAVEVGEPEPEPITAEHITAASDYLRGTIAEGLADTTTGTLPDLDTTLTKFHGVYQQDDRDIRDERLAAGIEPAYIFMIRVRVPGGVFVATAHGPWGILLGPATGWVVGEMVLGREPSVDVGVLGKWEADAP